MGSRSRATRRTLGPCRRLAGSTRASSSRCPSGRKRCYTAHKLGSSRAAMSVETAISMRSFLLGLLLGTLGPILVERLRSRPKSEPAEEPSQAAAGRSAEQPGDDGDAAPDDLSQLTAAELYRRAQAAGIAGRSGMSKAQLIAALQAVNG
jgi:hypothetical protein